MGRLSRLVEPAVLYLVATGQANHGYDLVTEANELCLTDSTIDTAAIYRVLRDLEEQGCVVSSWDTGGSGPARRVYQVTAAGRERLARWVDHIERWSSNMQQFVQRYRALGSKSPS
jgi:PadR family transcriptional regulator PadR